MGSLFFLGLFMVGMVLIYGPGLRSPPSGLLQTNYEMMIPKLGVHSGVIPNVDTGSKAAYLPALNRGIALAAGSAAPGQTGLGYYFAHSSGPQLTLFNHLHELMPGDEIEIVYQGQQYIYRVTKKQIVFPNNVSFLHEGTGDRIVLQTCWPIGTNLQRLLVFAERV